MVAPMQAASPPQTIGPYRILEVLGEGGMAIVYRAERAGLTHDVAIKTVRVPDASHLAGIRREIHALIHVRHPGIVRVLDQGVEAGLPWYTMELLEGRTLADDIRAAWSAPPDVAPTLVAPTLVASAPGTHALAAAMVVALDGRGQGTSRPLAGGADLPHFLQVMRELCETLAFLHGEGIVHRDLKPANVFLRGGVAPVLMDFGIAWRLPSAVGREVLDLPLPSAGTIRYMAPEQIVGKIVDARADLYSVGCILYEAVTGRLPFEAASNKEILVAQLFTKPTPPSHVVDGVQGELEELILRLLEKRPRERLGHAGDVASALAAIGAPTRPGWEPIRARAHVYRPELSGREDAMAKLTAHLDRLSGGSGGRVLVRGESGIGKTHLCMELARMASARKLEIITGSCSPVVPSGASSGGSGAPAAASFASSPNDAPLHALHPLLRTIADRCMESGPALSKALLGGRAKVLAVCEPALAHLPGLEDDPEPPELPARAARERILRYVAETITAFSQKWPLLLVLDDLQWADDLSIELLASLSGGYFDRCPALILGTYRAEQTRMRLEELGSMEGIARIDLGKLEEESVAAMVGDMLAMSPPPEAFVRFLSRRSEGNPFFVAEYVRAAVEEELLCRSSAGAWRINAAPGGEAAYDQLPLPASLGELCGRRLSDLSGVARELVEMASVLGREVDWDLLASAAAIADEVAVDASRELVARHILEEAEPGRLRFLHDKLREAAHDRVPASRRASLHGAAARAIEARSSGEASFPLVYAKLARHFTEAGDSGKAMEYLEKAGEHALKTSSHREAAGLFGELIAQSAKAGLDPTTEPGRLNRARWERHLTEAQFALGDFGAALEHAQRALSWSGQSLPRSQPGWILRLIREIPEQAVHRIAPDALGTPEGAERARAIEASMILEEIGHVYFFSDATRTLAASLWSMNLSERAGGGAKLAGAYAGLGAMLGFCKLPGLARSYFALARDTAERTKDEAGLVTALYVQGYWLHSRGGAWDTMRPICREAVEKARRLGDRNDIGFAEITHALTEFSSGHLDESRRQFEAVVRRAAEHAHVQHLAMSLVFLACALLRLGELDAAEARLEEARVVLERRHDTFAKPACLGLLAVVHLRKGDVDGALALANLVSSELDKAPMMMGLGIAYRGVAEAYLARYARALQGRPGEIAEARSALRRIVRRIFVTSLIHSIERPIYYRMHGRMHWIEGAPARAKRSWERGLAAAVKLDLPYDQAHAHIDLASAEPPGSDARRRHLDIAEVLGTKMGSRFALAEIEALRA